ncbi:hypothetical protein CUN91_00820 [Candidatus Carsonella ruddii]|uniref:Uncharacterized protein n=1 Tax=Carsonella ruddii TaxID=114186 RepID=A0A2K8K4G2_CARRU|nr:hypothetical protein [Candidatus Carsonella ruddii]ATX33492.1 hypothetical protein CUN91_00820 [Candidatus Carsonella ruddii]
MNKYNIYIIFEKKKIDSYSNFLKSFSSFFLRSKSNILKILDFGNYFCNKKIKRIFFLEINCKKKVLNKIPKLLKTKKELIIFFLILKNNINKYLLNIFFLKKYISKNFRLKSSILTKIKYSKHNYYSKIIKNLKIINIIPINYIFYIKKINFYYDK